MHGDRVSQAGDLEEEETELLDEEEIYSAPLFKLVFLQEC